VCTVKFGRMSAIDSRREARFTTIGVGLAAVCVVVFSVAHSVNAWALDRDVAALDTGTGDSAFEWVGTLAIVLSAVSAGILALRRRDALLFGLAGLLAVVAIDDIVGAHEDLPGGKLILLPVLAPILLLLWFLPAHVGVAARAVRIGLALLVFSLVVGGFAERIVDRQGWGPRDAGYELKTLVKDGSEVAGWMLVATGLVAAVSPRHSRAERG
jgi:hypothetical protein